jgi:DNA-directed RNA polymerase subunit RPC12/RpoP
MKDDLQDRMADPPRKRGRPTLAETLARQGAPPIQAGDAPLTFRCPACGADSRMTIERKIDEEHRSVRCHKCGRVHTMWLADIKMLAAQWNQQTAASAGVRRLP